MWELKICFLFNIHSSTSCFLAFSFSFSVYIYIYIYIYIYKFTSNYNRPLHQIFRVDIARARNRFWHPLLAINSASNLSIIFVPIIWKKVLNLFLILEQTPEVSFLNLKFLFTRQTWGRKLFHSLVLLCRTVDQN